MGYSPRPRRILPCLAVVLVLFLGSIGGASPAWGWGDLGHKIVCQIAFQELNAKARAEVVRLIALDSTFDSFTDACTWPDHPRKRAEEHFINVPRTLQTIATAQCQGAPTCLFTAIVTDREILRTSTDDTAKLASLKFLGHWVGDIHQPLHVSFADDRGGNAIVEQGPCGDDLHAVWDTCIIERKLGRDIRHIASELRSRVTDTERAAWTSTGAKDWASESFTITTAAAVRY